MKHDLVVYILKFKSENLIKIGKTENLRQRIAEHRRHFQDEFDLVNSYVITGRKPSIHILEKQILDDLNNDIPPELDFIENHKGASEIRYDRNLETILEIIKKRTELNCDVKIFYGIDLSGFASDLISNHFYPSEEEIESEVLSVSLGLMKEMAKERGTGILVVINEILFEYFVMTGRIKEKRSELREDYFLVPDKRFT